MGCQWYLYGIEKNGQVYNSNEQAHSYLYSLVRTLKR